MSNITDSRILITRGASGIERLMGLIALERGAKELVIWDINEVNIKSTIEELKSIGKVSGYKVDISDSNAVKNTIWIPLHKTMPSTVANIGFRLYLWRGCGNIPCYG